MLLYFIFLIREAIGASYMKLRNYGRRIEFQGFCVFTWAEGTAYVREREMIFLINRVPAIACCGVFVLFFQSIMAYLASKWQMFHSSEYFFEADGLVWTNCFGLNWGHDVSGLTFRGGQ